MTTKGVIDRIAPWCPGWARSSGKKNLLKIAEQGLDELFNFDHEKMVYRGTDNQGFPPYLITTAGTYDYDVSAANLSCGALTKTVSGTTHTFIARFVKKLFVDVTEMTTVYSRTYFGKPYWMKLNPYTTQTTRLFVAEEVVDTEPGYENTVPRVSFKQDPGTHSDRYFIEIVIGPPRLTAETIQMPIPVRFEKAIEEYVIGTVQSRESGRVHDYLTRFEQKWVPEFQRELIGSASTAPDETPPRRC